MSLGHAPRQFEVFATTATFCDRRVAENSIYALLHRECHRLFPDEAFADLFRDVGRRCVPPMIVAVVMVLQRVEGCSDREAVERFQFDARWKYAAGGLSFDYPGFAHTVLVDMRARLAGSERPDRIFEATLAVAKEAGLVGRRRVLDSTALYDAVATMDTVTLVRSAIRGVLAACADARLAAELRAALARDDDYRAAGKPVCDYDDPAAREQLVDALAKDARAILRGLDGRELPDALARAAEVLATVVGQDLDQGEDGVFRIARRVAKDRVISTVDRDARHGHKTSARGFDGYKGHAAVDPDSELITATAVTAGNGSDAAAAEQLLQAELGGEPVELAGADGPAVEAPAAGEPVAESAESPREPAGPLAVYGDSAYGAGRLLEQLERAGAQIGCKVQPPVAPDGHFAKDAFEIDLDTSSVRCPAGHTQPLRALRDRGQYVSFGALCADCPLRAQCTTSPKGRTITLSPHERQLQAARERQTDPTWRADYKATRPKVERKIGHLVRRKHGGRRARVRGQVKVAADFNLLAAATNLARLAVLGLQHTGTRWAPATS